MNRRGASASGEGRAELGHLPDASPESEALPPSPLRIIEALLFVGGEPLSAERAGEIIRGLSSEQFTQAVDTLNRAYRVQKRPYTIMNGGAGYTLALKPAHVNVVDKLYGGPREARLSTAAVDVLALVAYRQPAAKADIDGLRGADSGGLLRQLVRRGLVEIVRRGDADQREVAYTTTPRFLEWFGLQSLDDLPRTQDLQLL